MTADAQDLLQKQAKVAEGAANISNEYRKLTTESQRMGSAAKRAFEDTRNPLERYTLKMQQLDELLRQGKISQDVHARAVEVARGRFEQASQAGGVLAGTLGKLTSFAGGFLSVGSAIGVVTAAMRQAREEAERASEIVNQGFASRGELAQVVQGRTPAEMRADLAGLRQQAALFRTAGGIESEDLANQIVFALRSTGQMDAAATMREVGRTGLVSQQALPQLINSLDSLKDAFSQAEVGSVEQMLNKALIASAVSQTDIQKLLTATAKAGAGARALGFGDEETLAGIALLTDPLGSPEEAATRMRSLFKSLERSGIRGGTLGGALDIVQQRISEGKAVSDILGGDQEAIQAFRLLQTNRAQFGAVSAQLTQGATGRVLRDRIAVLETDVQQRAGISQRRIAGAVEVGREPLGTREILVQALNDSVDELRRLQGVGPVQRMLEGWERNAPLVGRLRAFDAPTFVAPDEAERIRQQQPEATAILKQILDTQRQLYELSRTEKQQRDEKQRTDDAKRTPRPNVPRPEA